MIRLLVRYGARLDIQDKYGNTLLHLCVEKELPDMYNYVLDLVDLYQDKIVEQRLKDSENENENKSKLERVSASFSNLYDSFKSKSEGTSKDNASKPEEKKMFDLETIKNLENRTPLNYAAVLGKPNMLQEIINRRRRVLWRYGNISLFMIFILIYHFK